jgi:hypothetical protein
MLGVTAPELHEYVVAPFTTRDAVCPEQSKLLPVTAIVGLAYTITEVEALEAQPVIVEVPFTTYAVVADDDDKSEMVFVTSLVLHE